ncbi:MAG: methyltransferase domain-containing protein [Deltaproteobacteria bacterium]|nr:methyltransferase domain-containing protein [Deltaproteobacteria bacterium]
MLRLTRILVICAALLGATSPSAQERFSFFQASTPESVERMLKLANLKDDDVIVDLGSGNGLIVLTAAKMNAKLRGWGVDIDPKLVAESNGLAKAQRVANRVKFIHQNAFDADLREATVITMWLFPELMRLLRPMILELSRPGTRVLTSTWDLGTWPADATDKGNPTIYLWTVPARIAGNWSWELSLNGQRVSYAAVLEQQFQIAEGVARAGVNREVLTDVKLNGENISFELAVTIEGLGLTRHEFKGKARGDRIEGTAQVALPEGNRVEIPWQATRTAKSAYFEPTGVSMP